MPHPASFACTVLAHPCAHIVPPPVRVQATIWSVIVYFVSGMSYADEGGHFFIFWGIMILVALQVSHPAEARASPQKQGPAQPVRCSVWEGVRAGNWRVGASGMPDIDGRVPAVLQPRGSSPPPNLCQSVLAALG